MPPVEVHLLPINELPNRDAKILSFRAVFADGTRTSPEKVWVQKMGDFRGFPGQPHPNVFGHIPVGNAFGKSEVYALARNRAEDCGVNV